MSEFNFEEVLKEVETTITKKEENQQSQQEIQKDPKKVEKAKSLADQVVQQIQTKRQRVKDHFDPAKWYSTDELTKVSTLDEILDHYPVNYEPDSNDPKKLIAADKEGKTFTLSNRYYPFKKLIESIVPTIIKQKPNAEFYVKAFHSNRFLLQIHVDNKQIQLVDQCTGAEMLRMCYGSIDNCEKVRHAKAHMEAAAKKIFDYLGLITSTIEKEGKDTEVK
jgi:hypothetical protein